MPGTHRIEFVFKPPIGLLYVSLAAIAGGIVLLGVLCVNVARKKNLVPASLPNPEERSLPKNAQLRPT